MSANTGLPMPLKWYHTWYGVALAGFVCAVLGVVIFFGVSVFKYYKEIKAGRGELLFNKIYGGFSVVDNKNNPTDVKREEVEITTAPFLGNAQAKTVIVEFVDYKCPNCLAADPILRKVLNKYGSKVKLIVRNFPAESIHPGANQLAEMATCAYSQGVFWPMHDYLFAHQADIGENAIDENMLNLLTGLGVDTKKFDACFKSIQTKTAINKDYADGYRFGVAGTPTFFINGYKVEGVVPEAVWDGYLKDVK